MSDYWFDYLNKHIDSIRALVGFYCRPTTQVRFEEALLSKDRSTLDNILNDVWYAAPDSRSIYDVPGFTEMCNLLDGTVDSWHGEEDE